MKMKRQIIYFVLGCSVLSGCNLYSNYERSGSAESTAKNLYRDGVSSTSPSQAVDTVHFGMYPWREVFTQPELQSLIVKALDNNADMKKAELNIEKAKAGLRISKLAYIPSLALAPQGTISSFDMGKASKTYTLPLSISWDFGSMGNLRNLKKQANVGLLQTKAAKQATQTAIISAVANMYYTLTMLDEQLKTSKETIELWQQSVETLEAMKQAGMVNELSVAQAKANLFELKASVPALENSIRATENALCVLLGETPHGIARGTFDSESFPAELSAGVPLQLLSARPDVRLSELALASQFYGVNIARAAMYPSLNITGTAGWTNSAGGMTINPPKFFANLAGSIVQPLFANGRLKANLKINKLALEEAEIDFHQTLLKAGQEVSDALSNYQTAVAKQQLREEEVVTVQEALDYVQFLFQHTNTTSYLETLTAQQSLISAQLALINDKYAKVQAVIALYQALGGGK